MSLFGSTTQLRREDGSEAPTASVRPAPAVTAVATERVAAISAGAVSWDDPLLVSLSIISGCLEKPLSTTALAAGLPVDERGFTPELFVRAAARAGFAARLAKRKLKSISPLNFPCVLLLKENGAAILTKREPDGTFELIMPESETSRLRRTFAEVEAQYAGYALFVKLEDVAAPTLEDLFAPDRKSGLFGGLLRLWPLYSQVVIASIIINLLTLASPLFVMNVYDRVVPNNAVETLWVLASGVFVVFFFDFLLRTLRAYFVDAAGKGADILIASRLFERMLGMQYASRPASTGAFANNMREYESVRDFFTSASLVALIDLPFVFLFVVIIHFIAGPVALVPLFAIPLVVMVGAIVQFPLRAVVRRAFREAAQKHSVLVEAIEGLDTIKITSAEARLQQRWEQHVGKTADSAMQSRALSTIGVNFALFAQNMVYVLVVIVGVYAIAAGELTVGGLIAASILAGRAMAPMTQIAGLLVRLHQSMASFASLKRLLSLPLEREAGRNFLIRRSFRGQIEFKDVSFQYPGQKLQALEKASFFIDSGERVGIIGRIGSGKSTIGRLVLGLYQPSAGSVLLDGADIRQIDPAELRRSIGCVPQDVFLFSGTVRENICIGVPNVDDAAVLRAATIAGVDDFLKRHPQGYDLPVGEQGRLISGGQRQAIGVARALLLDPKILVLDEPTSAMDNATESRLRERLSQIATDKTLILVTHRSSMLQLVDRLIVLDGGRVVADGPKQRVLDSLAQGQIRVAR
ncbi:MAG TPA: type I secretion system permease/ATPase [Alphaproteobacteria bacterium]|nr:type I secretion system permease/ATPase [Alphaproteobacteria bacterium]